MTNDPKIIAYLAALAAFNEHELRDFLDVESMKEQQQRRQKVIDSFTPEQIDHICYEIGEWYLDVELLLEGQHNLGYKKEVLKKMICGG